jgi:hypothetical protein
MGCPAEDADTHSVETGNPLNPYNMLGDRISVDVFPEVIFGIRQAVIARFPMPFPSATRRRYQGSCSISSPPRAPRSLGSSRCRIMNAKAAERSRSSVGVVIRTDVRESSAPAAARGRGGTESSSVFDNRSDA